MDNQIFHNKGTDALRVPGFGLPITHRIPRGRPLGAETKRFRHGISDYAGDRMVAREVYMLRLMEVITEKKDWQKKVFDENIAAKWSEEATVGNDSLICDKSFQWCIMELKDKARDYEVLRLTDFRGYRSHLIFDRRNCTSRLLSLPIGVSKVM